MQQTISWFNWKLNQCQGFYHNHTQYITHKSLKSYDLWPIHQTIYSMVASISFWCCWPSLDLLSRSSLKTASFQQKLRLTSVYSLMLSSCLFFSLLALVVLCSIVFVCPGDLDTCPHCLSLHFFHNWQHAIILINGIL